MSVSSRVGSMIDDILGDEQQVARSKPMFQDYKKFKHGKEVPQEAEIQYLKQHLLAQTLVNHKHVIHMPHDLLDPNPTNTVDFIMMESREYSTKNTWYVEYEVTGSPEQKEVTTLAVIDITKDREAKILQVIAESYSVPQSNPDKETTRKRLEAFVQERLEPLKQWQKRLHKYTNDRRKIRNRCIGKSQKRLSQHQNQFGKISIC